MTIFFALIALGAVVATVLRLHRTITSDGYGNRPPPRSHPAEFPPGLSRL